jgi:hypothetical protein
LERAQAEEEEKAQEVKAKELEGLSTDEIEELLQKAVDEDDSGGETILFIPLGLPKEIMSEPYKGSDPEWQAFRKFAQDNERRKVVQSKSPPCHVCILSLLIRTRSFATRDNGTCEAVQCYQPERTFWVLCRPESSSKDRLVVVRLPSIPTADIPTKRVSALKRSINDNS